MNGAEQGLSRMWILLLRKAFHDGPFVDFEAIRQRQKAVALKGLANLGHRLALPIWKFIVSDAFFHQCPVVFAHLNNLPGVRIEIGRAFIALGFNGIHDVMQRKDNAHICRLRVEAKIAGYYRTNWGGFPLKCHWDWRGFSLLPVSSITRRPCTKELTILPTSRPKIPGSIRQ